MSWKWVIIIRQLNAGIQEIFFVGDRWQLLVYLSEIYSNHEVKTASFISILTSYIIKCYETTIYYLVEMIGQFFTFKSIIGMNILWFLNYHYFTILDKITCLIWPRIPSLKIKAIKIWCKVVGGCYYNYYNYYNSPEPCFQVRCTTRSYTL